MTRLVDNLLDMTRLESGSQVVNKQWNFLEEIVGTALARWKRELRQHTVRVNISPEVPLLDVDGVLLEQMFGNLFENTARYTPAGSSIEVSARRAGRFVEIVVADNGPGLPPGSESRVFEKFFRAGKAAGDSRRGVGLGLAICEAIVRAHGGSITARNRPAGGAEFVILIPADSEPPQVVLDAVAASGVA
jgi:two-component system sensor histidine kinase KdpD